MNTEENLTISRRTLMRNAAITTGAAIALTQSTRIAQAAASSKLSLKPGDTILFQGDSITDAGRDRKRLGANDSGALGRGYPAMITSRLLGVHSSLKLQCINRGISGHKVPDLQGRWKKDTIDLNPAVLSILIGVNDIWHKLNGNYKGTVEDYERGFNALLLQTTEALPNTRLVICEPFALRCGAINDSWFPEFDHRRAAAKRVSEKFNTTWVPFQTMFDEATNDTTPASYWAGDGVHPTLAGHALMAKTWLDITGLG